MKGSNAIEEILYFFLFLLDIHALKILGSNKRNDVFDEVSTMVLTEYNFAVLKEETPKEIAAQLLVKMIDKLNERQSIYSKCKSIFGEGFPSRGSAVFALSFFIHKALGNTNRNNVSSILSGETDLNKNDLKDFPNSDFTLKLSFYLGAMNEKNDFPKLLKKLK